MKSPVSSRFPNAVIDQPGEPFLPVPFGTRDKECAVVGEEGCLEGVCDGFLHVPASFPSVSPASGAVPEARGVDRSDLLAVNINEIVLAQSDN